VCKRVAALLAAFVLVLGCNKKDDLNKDLKPIDPNTPPPKMAGGENGGDGHKAKTPPPTEGAPPVVK
jgi:hypothetical protein